MANCRRPGIPPRRDPVERNTVSSSWTKPQLENSGSDLHGAMVVAFGVLSS